MKKTSVLTLILLLPILAVLTGLTALPEGCFAQEALSVTMSLDKKNVIRENTYVTVTLTPSGGTPPYIYEYTMILFDYEHDEHGETFSFWSGFQTDNSYLWLVCFGNIVSFIGSVRDAHGARASCEASLEIWREELHDPLKITGLSLHPGNSINVGDTITCSVVAEGGRPPYTYGYELRLYRDGCWSVPASGDGLSSNSFSYTVTGGTGGDLYFTVEDSVEREVMSEITEFTILGDDSAPFELSATAHSLVKLGDKKYRATLQADVKGAALPASYVCWWYLFKDGELYDRIHAANTDGAFSFEGDFEVAIAEVYVTDADGWSSEDFLEIYFNTKDAVRPVLSEVIRMDLLRASLRDNLLNYSWTDLIAQLYHITEPDSGPIPDVILPEMIRQDLFEPELVNLEQINPRLVNPGLVNPEATEPEETEPEIVPPEIINPNIIMPLVPNLQQIQLPSFPSP